MDGAFTAFCSSRSIPDASTAMPATLDAVSAYFAGMTAAETAGSTRGTGERLPRGRRQNRELFANDEEEKGAEEKVDAQLQRKRREILCAAAFPRFFVAI